MSLLNGDKYLINMIYAHWKAGTHEQLAMYDMFYRTPPFGGNFVVYAGLKHILEHIENIQCHDEDVAWLESQSENYESDFIKFIRGFNFDGKIYSMNEGQFVFPNEPMVKVIAPIYQCILVGSAILSIVNYESLVATKAARIRIAAGDDRLVEMGMRRAHGLEAGFWGARAAHIAGFDATSNMAASREFNIPATGTMAHEWVQSFDDEYTAFIKYAEAHPHNTTFLVDTYSTLKSGVPNAIKAAEWMKKKGLRLVAIRLDSGDMFKLSIEARKMLDAAGLDYVEIVASNNLNENEIVELKERGAPINTWGVGTNLITGGLQPSLGGVYKLSAVKRGEEWKPVFKMSETPAKSVIPGVKWPHRFISDYRNRAEFDVISNSCYLKDGDALLFEHKHPLAHDIVFRDSLKTMPDYVLDLQKWTRKYPVKLSRELSDLRVKMREEARR